MARDAEMIRPWKQDALVYLAAFDLLPHRLRPMLLRKAGVEVGEPCLIMSGLKIVREGHVTIGAEAFISYDCYIDAAADVTIGYDVRIADHVRLVTSTHELGPSNARAGAPVGGPVRIDDGVWLGSGVTVLPDVRVARGCVIAAGAVVTKSTEPDGLYAGVPAVRRKDLRP